MARGYEEGRICLFFQRSYSGSILEASQNHYFSYLGVWAAQLARRWVWWMRSKLCKGLSSHFALQGTPWKSQEQRRQDHTLVLKRLLCVTNRLEGAMMKAGRNIVTKQWAHCLACTENQCYGTGFSEKKGFSARPTSKETGDAAQMCLCDLRSGPSFKELMCKGKYYKLWVGRV